MLPNYRTADLTAVYMPITWKQKLTIASKDSFDYPLVLLAGAFAGLGQLTNQHPEFDQGMAGFGRRIGTAYADQAIGNMMTEGFMPILLHEDPRYFRLGSGSKWHRTGYALTRIFVTKTDSGGTRFNFSEWTGNAIGVGISNAYYPDGRTVFNETTKLLEQCGTDAVSQVLKEFWPDIKHRFFQKHSSAGSLRTILHIALFRDFCHAARLYLNQDGRLRTRPIARPPGDPDSIRDETVHRGADGHGTPHEVMHAQRPGNSQASNPVQTGADRAAALAAIRIPAENARFHTGLKIGGVIRRHFRENAFGRAGGRMNKSFRHSIREQ